MGGIPTDENGQVSCDNEGTPVVGFYAAGECACVSVHGANRLGTNSLLEASLFGKRVGQSIARFVEDGAVLQPLPGDPAERNRNRIQLLLGKEGSESVEAIAQDLKTNMTDNCGIYRDAERLGIVATEINELRARFEEARIMDKSSRFNTDLLATIEAEHLLSFSEVIVAGALARMESRGAHSRTDFKARDDEEWLKHTLAHMGEDGPVLSYKPVQIFWERFPPQERKY
jgi:succinate dehydrogenase / fumarate reductase flavoprotein subunit